MHFNAYQSDNSDDKSFNNVTMGFDSTAFATRSPVDGKILNKSSFTEKFTMTRSQYSPFVSFDGMFGSVDSTTTFEYSTLYQPKNFYAQGGIMYSLTDFEAGLVNDVTPITSVYAMAGWSDDNVNLYTGIKPMVVHGSVNLNLPTSVSTDGIMNYTNHTVALNNGPIGFIGGEYRTNLVENQFGQTHSLKMSGVLDQNKQYQIGAFYEFSF